jgi:hypothetical protein
MGRTSYHIPSCQTGHCQGSKQSFAALCINGCIGPFCFPQKNQSPYPRPTTQGAAGRSSFQDRFYITGTLPQPSPFQVYSQPSPVVGLIAEALGLCCQVLGLACWNTTLVDVDGHPFFESFDIRDKAMVCYRGRAHDAPSQSGNLITSTISRFWASDIPAEYSP